MLQLLRTNSGNSDFLELIRLLDADLAIRDGEDHSFYSQFNKIDDIKYVVLAHENHKSVGCGAIREYSPGIMEIKRMFVLPETRGKGIATTILAELERWAIELSYTQCILETGYMQPEAIGLYQKNGYKPVPN